MRMWIGSRDLKAVSPAYAATLCAVHFHPTFAEIAVEVKSSSKVASVLVAHRCLGASLNNPLLGSWKPVSKARRRTGGFESILKSKCTLAGYCNAEGNNISRFHSKNLDSTVRLVGVVSNF